MESRFTLVTVVATVVCVFFASRLHLISPAAAADWKPPMHMFHVGIPASGAHQQARHRAVARGQNPHHH